MSAIAISKHLVVLEKAGIVQRQREENVQNCVLNAPVLSGVESRIGAYRHYWSGQFDGLAKFVDTQGRGNFWCFAETTASLTASTRRTSRSAAHSTGNGRLLPPPTTSEN